ncbi:MAG: 7-cyano-7-deazaguanine synthase [Candidatus Cloacimonetes bacterium]|nr:7-cyano-7-deazaguanine synthase [Candidatus Cloacimonadota bacterium]
MSKAIVLVSGGIDSLVTACIAIEENDEIYFLHVNYGQRTEKKELKAFQKICDFYKPKDKKIIDIGYLKQFGGSSLTDKNIDIPINIDPFEIPNTYVPFRNGNLIAIACSWAEVLNIQNEMNHHVSERNEQTRESQSQITFKIYIGAIEVEGSNYPDCRSVFFQSLEKAINLGTKYNINLEIKTPIINLTKSNIIKLGKSLNAPYELTWSCYSENEIACGECDSCFLRLKAFKEADLEDPIIYRNKN